MTLGAVLGLWKRESFAKQNLQQANKHLVHEFGGVAVFLWVALTGSQRETTRNLLNRRALKKGLGAFWV